MNATTDRIDEQMESQPRPRRRRLTLAAGAALAVVAAGAIGIGLEVMSYAPTEPHPIALSVEPELLKRAVLHQVPIGCNMWLARDVMEMNGFHCQLRRSGTFFTSRPNGSEIRDFENRDYLYCTKTEPLVIGISDIKYQVAITIKKSVVSGVYADVDEIVTAQQ